MSLFQALIIAILQGATELFPVSSLGHAVILPRLLGWPIDQKAPDFLPFLVVLHLGTAAALLLYFWRDWRAFLLAVIGRGPEIGNERRLFGLIAVATVPAVVIGFALEHILRGLFGAPTLAAAFLVINGGILFLGERIKHRQRIALTQLGWAEAIVIGACQALALIPGISRSGATMVGGVLAGLSHKDAARFSFLLATPVIAGAGVLEVPKLLHAQPSGAAAGAMGSEIVIMAGIAAAITAYISTAILMRYFRQHELDAFRPFAFYCWIAGALSLALMLLG